MANEGVGARERERSDGVESDLDLSSCTLHLRLPRGRAYMSRRLHPRGNFAASKHNNSTSSAAGARCAAVFSYRLRGVLQQLGAPDLLDTFLLEGFGSFDEVVTYKLCFEDYQELGSCDQAADDGDCDALTPRPTPTPRHPHPHPRCDTEAKA